MKLSALRIEEGIVTGLAVAAIIGVCLLAFRYWQAEMAQPIQN